MTQPSDPRSPHPLSQRWDGGTEALPAVPAPAEAAVQTVPSGASPAPRSISRRLPLAATAASALTAVVREHPAGDAVTLTVLRDGEERQVDVTLGDS